MGKNKRNGSKLTEKECKEAIKRLEAYHKDMSEGKIDLSGCVELSTYPYIREEYLKKNKKEE